MFRSLIDQCVVSCYKELINSKEEEIQCLVKKYQKEFKREADFILQTIVENLVSKAILEQLSDEQLEDMIVPELENQFSDLQKFQKSVLVEVCVEGLEEEINRVLELPMACSIEQFACAILGTFQCEGNHLYSVNYKDDRFVSLFEGDDPDENIWYASYVYLTQLNLRKNSKLEIEYDYGENYTFKIHVQAIKKHSYLFKMEDAQILDGKGFGIWEDSHVYLDLYYKDRKAFYERLEADHLEENMFPVDVNFDLDIENDALYDYTLNVLETYKVD